VTRTSPGRLMENNGNRKAEIRPGWR